MTKRRTYPRRGLHGAVVHEIGVRIVDGELKPGDTLPDNGLLDDAAVSRTVVREAIKVLAAKGLVESRPKVGTRVRQRRDWNLLDPDVLAWQIEAGPDARFLEQALELRRMIEPAAARLAAARASDAQIAALYEAYEEMAAAGDDLDTFMAPDLRFHSLLLEACGNELLEHMSEIFTAVLRTVFAYSSSSSRSYPRAARRHRAIAKAIEARDPNAAEQAVLRLIDDTKKNLASALRLRPRW
jgi:GntR family transcriptional regulator, galactonate operon transcriptional repressor